MSPDEWSVELERRADRDLGRLDPQVRARVFAAIDEFASDPHAADVRKLTNRAQWRLRVGDWRVLFRYNRPTRTIIVERVLPRGRAYGR